MSPDRHPHAAANNLQTRRHGTSSSVWQTGARIALFGLAINIVLASVKILAGFFGHAYVLIADGIESALDVGGLIVISKAPPFKPTRGITALMRSLPSPRSSASLSPLSAVKRGKAQTTGPRSLPVRSLAQAVFVFCVQLCTRSWIPRRAGRLSGPFAGPPDRSPASSRLRSAAPAKWVWIFMSIFMLEWMAAFPWRRDTRLRIR